MVPALRSLNIASRYRSDRQDVVADFYVPALSASVSYSRAVGYFTSTSLALFARCDVLLSTPTQGPAPLLAEQRPDDGFARPFLTSMANVAALPSLVVCGGFSAGGLPLGVELIGRPWTEAVLLRVGHQLERANGTRERRPEVGAVGE